MSKTVTPITDVSPVELLPAQPALPSAPPPPGLAALPDPISAHTPQAPVQPAAASPPSPQPPSVLNMEIPQLGSRIPVLLPGQRVVVDRFGDGVVRFFGLHHADKKLRCGVELDEAVGLNDGTVAVTHALVIYSPLPLRGTATLNVRTSMVCSWTSARCAPWHPYSDPTPTLWRAESRMPGFVYQRCAIYLLFRSRSRLNKVCYVCVLRKMSAFSKVVPG